MERRPVFLEQVPTIEIKDGLVYITDKFGLRTCATVHNFEVFLEAGHREVVAWHAKQSPVVQLRRR